MDTKTLQDRRLGPPFPSLKMLRIFHLTHLVCLRHCVCVCVCVFWLCYAVFISLMAFVRNSFKFTYSGLYSSQPFFRTTFTLLTGAATCFKSVVIIASYVCVWVVLNLCSMVSMLLV